MIQTGYLLGLMGASVAVLYSGMTEKQFPSLPGKYTPVIRMNMQECDCPGGYLTDLQTNIQCDSHGTLVNLSSVPSAISAKSKWKAVDSHCSKCF